MAWSMLKKPWLQVQYYDPDKDCSEVTYKFLKKAAIDCTEEMVQSVNYNMWEIDCTSGNNPYIEFQYFYNEHTNKSFIQYCVHDNMHYWEINAPELTERINRRIKSQFYYDTGIYAEIMNYSQTDITADNRRMITPYTIGYWRAIEGHYETIEDRAQVTLDSHNVFLLPDIAYRKLQDFFPIAEDISRRYGLYENATLAREQQAEYINKHYELLQETHGEGDYQERLNALNEEYSPNIYNNKNIPAAFNEYWTKYKQFFNGIELPRIENLASRFTIVIHCKE